MVFKREKTFNGEIKTKTEQTTSLFADIKSILKLKVLILNIFPVFTGFWLALVYSQQSFMDNIWLFILSILGSTSIVAGALMLNNWYEVDLDREMLRTKERPTVTGNFSLKSVLRAGILFSVLGQVLLLFTTIEAALYGFIGWFTYVVLYTFWSKRKYTLNTVIGSVSGAVTPLIGWAAITSANHIVPIVLFLILFIWQIPHTFAIAMRRSEEYRAAGVPMLPVVYGYEMARRQTVIYIACLLPLPFLLTSLGPGFIMFAAVLNISWIILGLSGFFMADSIKWAYRIFISSLIYLMLLFGAMIVVTIL